MGSASLAGFVFGLVDFAAVERTAALIPAKSRQPASFAGRSRFIPASLAHHFNRVSWPVARQAKGPAPIGKAQVDIRERMRGMWSKTG